MAHVMTKVLHRRLEIDCMKVFYPKQGASGFAPVILHRVTLPNVPTLAKSHTEAAGLAGLCQSEHSCAAISLC